MDTQLDSILSLGDDLIDLPILLSLNRTRVVISLKNVLSCFPLSIHSGYSSDDVCTLAIPLPWLST